MEKEVKEVVKTKEEIQAMIDEFHRERKMFYFDENGNIHFPPLEFKDGSHEEWFKHKKINIESVIRGYIYNRNAYCYIGKDFRVPNLTVNEYSILRDNLECWTIYLGLISGEPGEVWKAKYSIHLYDIE